MSVNALTTEQSYAFLTDLYEDATGQSASIQVVDTKTFTTVATSVLKTGTDAVMSSLSRVLGRTVFAVRPYSAKFKGIRVDAKRFGDIVRKINYIDTTLESDDRLTLTDGSSVDQWVVKKPKAVQTNFYGDTEYQKHITIFKDQLDAAFESPNAFGSFIGGVLQNIADQLEQVEEEEARGVLINMVLGKKAANADCINVLQEYYNETGTTLTPQTMYNSANFVPFVKWLYAYVNTLTDLMAQRSINYHMNITGKEVMRHTPVNMMKAYMYAGVANKIGSTVLSSVFSPEKLKMIDFEKVAFWQNIKVPEGMKAKPAYLKVADGDIVEATSTVQIDHLLGVIFDEDALGITRESTWTQATPMNARGGYYNIFWHYRQKTWNDFTENCVVLYADTVTP